MSTNLKETWQGRTELELLTANPEKLLNTALRMEIPLRELRAEDACTFRTSIPDPSLSMLEEAASRSQTELLILKREGGARFRRKLRRLAPLFLGLLLVLLLIWYSSLYVWELNVLGCERVSRGEILRVLAESGLEEGCYWPSLDVDLLRSRVLLRIPELQWMTVQVSGSRASVLVLEREEIPRPEEETGRADLIAGSAGIVRSVSVLRGQSLVSPGESVLPGEILVSGRVESSFAPPQELRARGEVFADTWPEYTAVCPRACTRLADSGRRQLRFACKIGKKCWFFFGRSGKTLDGYGTIVHEYRLGVPGVFAFPVSILREERILWSESEGSCDIREEMRSHLRAMLRGEILSSAVREQLGETLLSVSLTAHCVENIAEPTEAS